MTNIAPFPEGFDIRSIMTEEEVWQDRALEAEEQVAALREAWKLVHDVFDACHERYVIDLTKEEIDALYRAHHLYLSTEPKRDTNTT